MRPANTSVLPEKSHIKLVSSSAISLIRLMANKALNGDLKRFFLFFFFPVNNATNMFTFKKYTFFAKVQVTSFMLHVCGFDTTGTNLFLILNVTLLEAGF